MVDIGNVWREHLRLTILRLLKECPEYSANESILHDSMAPLGFRVSRDQLRGELAWLTEQGLITTEQFGDLTVATAARRGIEAAGGMIGVPGVRRPGPRS